MRWKPFKLQVFGWGGVDEHDGAVNTASQIGLWRAVVSAVGTAQPYPMGTMTRKLTTGDFVKSGISHIRMSPKCLQRSGFLGFWEWKREAREMWPLMLGDGFQVMTGNWNSADS